MTSNERACQVREGPDQAADVLPKPSLDVSSTGEMGPNSEDRCLEEQFLSPVSEKELRASPPPAACLRYSASTG